MDELIATVFGHEAPQAFVAEWTGLATEQRVERDEMIVRQLHPARSLFILIEGCVEHTLALEARSEQFTLGNVSERFSPLGWSGFIPPYRYATSARATTPCRLYSWPLDDVDQLFARFPEAGGRFFAYVFATMQPLFDETRQRIEATPVAADLLRDSQDELICLDRRSDWGLEQRRRLLDESMFTEGISGEYLDVLSRSAEIVHLRAGDPLHRPDRSADGLLLLASGLVDIHIARATGAGELFLRSFSVPGQVVGGGAFGGLDMNRERAVAARDSTVLRIAKPDIEALSKASPAFALQFARRWLWLLNARLRTLRINLIAQQCNDEPVVIQDLLGLVSPQLRIDSPLYKLPHLLANRVTHAEAFECLNELQKSGTGLERILASVCRGLLSELWRELKFYEGLNRVYRIVTEAPPEQPATEIRHASCVAFQQAFKHAPYRIEGADRLPRHPGNIVILNHLISCPAYALANGFEFALDTHFVSSMLLEPAYGDCGVRVVRRGRGEEHGHHSYYDRLGHIYVYTSESDARDENAQDIEARRARFTQTAGDILRAGTNLVICPEGTSNPIGKSPSAFKKGTFHLAAALSPEPLIVPIAVVNVDRRLKGNTLVAVVHEPFRLSERCDPADKDSLAGFLDRFRHSYRGYVRDALALACTT